MKTYFSDLIPRLYRFSQKLDNSILLTNKHWVVIDEFSENKNVYIFRKNNELLISINGKVEKAKWEYIGNNSVLIDLKDESYLFKHGFVDENILALKVDSKDQYAFLVNESKFEEGLDSIKKITDSLSNKYIETNAKEKRHLKNSSNIQPNKAYTHKKIEEYKPFFGYKTEKFEINFSDGFEGYVFLNHYKMRSYFIENRSKWTTLFHDYENLDLCINGLLHYLKTGSILEEGLVKTR